MNPNTSPKQRKPGRALFVITALIALFSAQVGSALINHYLELGRSIELTSFLYFTHIRNLGGIFGMLQGHGYLFGILALVVLGALSFFIWRSQNLPKIELLCFGLVVGGGLSNVVDRMVYGSVIDFIDVRGIPHWNYIFNTADVYIHLGIWPLLIYSMFVKNEKEAEPEVEEGA